MKGAEVLLKDTPAQTILADKAYDAQARLIEPLLNNGKAVVYSFAGDQQTAA